MGRLIEGMRVNSVEEYSPRQPPPFAISMRASSEPRPTLTPVVYLSYIRAASVALGGARWAAWEFIFSLPRTTQIVEFWWRRRRPYRVDRHFVLESATGVASYTPS